MGDGLDKGWVYKGVNGNYFENFYSKGEYNAGWYIYNSLISVLLCGGYYNTHLSGE